MLTVVLLAIVVIGYFLWRSEQGPYDDSMYSKKDLGNGIWLYVTKYNNAAATDSDVYRYYLNKKLDDAMPILQEAAPFLTTDTGDAKVSAIGQRVTVSLTGRIYSFSNSDFFYNGSVAVMPRIDINAHAPINY
ncbi:hypothetical protein GIX45_13635 [Erwinia sp. CPCC 100877]|nr:hypothetical protein [Erwinia sp. CPCC 100877]